MASIDFFHRVTHLAHCCAGTNGLNGQVQQITRVVFCCKSNSCQRPFYLGWVTFFLDILEPCDLPLAHRNVVNVARLKSVFLFQPVLVDAHDHVFAAIDAGLFLRCSSFNLELGPAAVHGLGHAAHGLDFFDERPGRIGHVLRQCLHHVAASPGVDHVGNVGFFLDDELGVARDARRKFGGQRNRFVKAVGVQALRAAEYRRHRLYGGAHHVVVGVLLGQAPATGLAVGAQHQRLGLFRVEAFHDAAPQQARGAHLGHFQVEVHANGPEEGEAPGKLIHVHALGNGGLHILLAIGQRESQLQRLVGAGFLHVVTRDADRVELRHVLRGVLNDVADDAHGRRGRVDVGVAHHELFQNVVLNRPAQLVLAHTLLFRRHHVAGQHRQHGAVHGHGDADFAERYLVEQNLHVLHRVNRHAGLADIARHARVVAVIAAVRGQIEGHAHALPPRSERLAVKGVGFFGRRKARVLADGPGPHRIHGRLRTAQVGLKTRQRVGVGQVLDVLGRV